jgi:hypothetical protein
MEPGDIGFAHTKDFIGKAIRFGEWVRWRKGDYWNHVFVVDRIVDDVVYILQADSRGVTNGSTLASLGEYVLVEMADHADKTTLLSFCRRQLKDGYSWSTILAIAVDIISPRWFPSFRSASKRKASWICSTLTAEAMRFGGWYYSWPDIYFVSPSQLYEALNPGASLPAKGDVCCS